MIERVWAMGSVIDRVHLRRRGQQSFLCGQRVSESPRVITVPDSDVTCVKCRRHIPVSVVKRKP